MKMYTVILYNPKTGRTSVHSVQVEKQTEFTIELDMLTEAGFEVREWRKVKV